MSMHQLRTTAALTITAGALLGTWIPVAAVDLEPDAPTVAGEPLPDSVLGDGYVETMAEAIARDEAMPPGPKHTERGEIGFNGKWVVPSRRGTFHPHSGAHYATVKGGDTLMGIGFPEPVDVRGTFIAGQASEGVWAEAVRVIGYRDGREVGRTAWHESISDTPAWFAIDLFDVDRIVFEAQPVFRGAAWYAIDDFTYVRPTKGDEPVEPVILDFDDGGFRRTLTGSGYAGLTWEAGRPEPPALADEGVPAPVTPPALDRDRGVGRPDPAGGGPRGGLGTTPMLVSDFGGVIRGDATSFSFPPDTCAAAGTTQIVEVVNRNFAVYDKATGTEQTNILLGSFLPGSNGDPRVLFDTGTNRWIVLVTDFNATIFLAVSLTDDAMGSWFKTSFAVSIDGDSGCFPDYPTLGYDSNYVYTTAYMVGCGMSIFAVDKAPLIDPVPSLGTVFAFRGLPFEGAIQPTGTPGSVSYFVSTQSSSLLRMRSITDVGGSPVLTEMGSVSIPGTSQPPNAPALGSTTPLNTVGDRLMNAVFRNGEVWTAHTINVSGRAGCSWYRIDVDPLSLIDNGLIADSSLNYFFPALDVNANGDMAIGFSGSDASQYVGCYFTGRLATDPPGETGPPVQFKAGQASQNNVDQVGRNRWGDYSLTTVDPVDGVTFWTIQEYAEAVDIWGTWIAEIAFDGVVPLRIDIVGGLPDAAQPGDDPVVTVSIFEGDDTLVGGVDLLYRASAGESFASTPMSDIGGGQYQATISDYDCGDEPEYYFQAAGTMTGTVTNPAGAPGNVYSFLVGELNVELTDDFETDQGWTATSTASSGDWERGVPLNNGRGDPPSDADGSGQCYLTDNDPTTTNSDVDGGTVTLTSPAFDLSEGGTVSYQYWLNDTAGGPMGPEDSMEIEVATNVAGDNWTNIRTYGSPSGSWRTDTIEVGPSGDVAPTATLRLRVRVSDLDPADVVEGGFDAFEISSFDCVPVTSCPADITGPAGAPDGNVDALDVLVLIAQWGSPCSAPCTADITGSVAGVPDGNADALDYLLLVAQWGTPANCP
jgi:hypothetical protein